jgi:hypothetical protein
MRKNSAGEQLVVNLSCQNVVLATRGSKWMLFCKLPTNVRKHFEGQKVENSLNLEDEVLEYVRGLCNSGVSVLHKMLNVKAWEMAIRQGIILSQ